VPDDSMVRGSASGRLVTAGLTGRTAGVARATAVGLTADRAVAGLAAARFTALV
jgi:hypothetical protein